MPSPFPGMDPFLEDNPPFHELHGQFLAEAQRQLQPQLDPRYIAKMERHLSEGSVWDGPEGLISLRGKEPDVTVLAAAPGASRSESTALLATPLARNRGELDPDELQLRRQRRIVIYVQQKPRMVVAAIELLSPSNKTPGSIGQLRYLEKRSSALHGGLHWIEIDLLRGGQRPPIMVELPRPCDYLAYVAQATPTGWDYLAYGWGLRDPLPRLPIPLLGSDQVVLDLESCFCAAYDGIGAKHEADYQQPPPGPPLSADDAKWVDELLRAKGLRTGTPAEEG